MQQCSTQGSGQRSRTRSAIAAVQLLGNGGQRRRPRTDECQHGDECQPGNKRNVVTTLSLLVGDRHTRRGPVRPSLGGCNDCHLGYRSFAHELSVLYGVFNSRNRRESISRIGAGKRSAFIPDLQQNPSLGGVLFIFGNRETLSILWFTNFQMSARKEHWASIRLNEIPRCCLCLKVEQNLLRLIQQKQMPNDRLAIVYCGAAVLAMVRWCGAAPAAASSTSLHGTRVRLECPAEHMHLVGFPIEKRKRLASIGKARPSSPVGFRRASKRSSAEGQMRVTHHSQSSAWTKAERSERTWICTIP